jgi:hypothetical protein
MGSRSGRSPTNRPRVPLASEVNGAAKADDTAVAQPSSDAYRKSSRGQEHLLFRPSRARAIAWRSLMVSDAPRQVGT